MKENGPRIESKLSIVRSESNVHTSSFPLYQSISNPRGRIEILGPSYLRIYKITLPFDATHIFQRIIQTSVEYDNRMLSSLYLNHKNSNVTKLEASNTPLYSLTKHDVAVIDLKDSEINESMKFVQSYVSSMIQYLYGLPSIQNIYMDRNQPHVLKYDATITNRERNFCSVPLHYDRCHVTVNMVMNSRLLKDYVGGGTYFLDLNETVYCEPNEFIIHPGHVVHEGRPITSGLRYLLISFIDFVL